MRSDTLRDVERNVKNNRQSFHLQYILHFDLPSMLWHIATVFVLFSGASPAFAAARDPFKRLGTGKTQDDGSFTEINSPDRVELLSRYGRIVLKLLSDGAPNACAAVRRLAEQRGCINCNFYRAEARPNSGKGQPPEGPPYALLQGKLDVEARKEQEGKIPIKAGHVAFIPGTNDFFIALEDHPEWGTSHTVFAEVEDFVAVDLIAIQPYREVKHNQYGGCFALT